MTYRIAVTGAEGTGKSGLAERLSSRLGIPLVEDDARGRVSSLGYQTIFELPDSASVRNEQFTDLIQRCTETVDFVSDGSVVESCAHWQRWEWAKASPAESEALYERARTFATCYTHILVLQPTFQPPYDGFRWVEPNHRRQVARLIRSLLVEWDLMDRSLIMESDSPGSRYEQALTFVTSDGVSAQT